MDNWWIDFCITAGLCLSIVIYILLLRERREGVFARIVQEGRRQYKCPACGSATIHNAANKKRHMVLFNIEYGEVSCLGCGEKFKEQLWRIRVPIKCSAC